MPCICKDEWTHRREVRIIHLDSCFKTFFKKIIQFFGGKVQNTTKGTYIGMDYLNYWKILTKTVHEPGPLTGLGMLSPN